MSRTRKTPNTKGGSPEGHSSPNSTPEPQSIDSNGSSPSKINEDEKNIQNTKLNDHFVGQNVILKPDLVNDADKSAQKSQVNGSTHSSSKRQDDSLF